MPTAAKIRSLFLSPHPTYSVAEAADLLAMDVRDVRGWIESGELEGVETAHGLAVPWSELVSFGIDFWSQEVVEEALGADAIEVIPELLQLTELEVRIPRMQVVTLERLAARSGETVSGVLARELRDLVSVHSEWLSVQVPEFGEALGWPGAAGAVD